METRQAALGGLFDAFGLDVRIAITVAAIGFLLVVLLTYRRLQRWLNDRTKPLYSDILSTTILIGSCLLSLSVVLGTWGLTDDVRDVYSEYFGQGVLVQAAVTFILVVGTVIVTRFVKRVLEELLGSASAITDHQREITHRVTQVIIWSVSLVVILGVWVDDLGGLLVGAGFAGIVIGIAAQQTLGTVLSGFVLMFDRPFEIGDWIEVDDEEGIVTDISIVNTRLQSFDGEYIMIPNDVISSSMVTNRSRRGRLRIEVDVGVDYESDPERAAEIARSRVEELDASLTAPSPQVITKEFGDSAVVLGVRFWIDNPNARRYNRARTTAINEIKAAFEEAGIKIPYPQRELSGRAETGGFRIADDGRPNAPSAGNSRSRGERSDADSDDGESDSGSESESEPTPGLPSEDD
ncbi:mechanosensitive ion channel family protein [Natronolimnohabitans innermongolicus]|uniref:Mechanosensitive ion channel MscS n=1 Tax=Natronolimnohabitans innermongolicus JCM 12255 TaxID=1227499 RepID=L9WQQ0_9EURY|nr:mechanosensitive ion channel family protein [Natronolimnohabitans innermongolicus]ELY51727.1 mechanosensitive ion channel MscS [Natronolimnohabitans innermongolicus JCM 12255]